MGDRPLEKKKSQEDARGTGNVPLLSQNVQADSNVALLLVVGGNAAKTATDQQGTGLPQYVRHPWDRQAPCFVCALDFGRLFRVQVNGSRQ